MRLRNIPRAESVLEACKDIKEKLIAEGIRAKVDDDDTKTPGWKFSEWEMKGVPLRIEVGPRDLANKQAVLVKRVNGEKTIADIAKIDAGPTAIAFTPRTEPTKKAIAEAGLVSRNGRLILEAAIDSPADRLTRAEKTLKQLVGTRKRS